MSIKTRSTHGGKRIPGPGKKIGRPSTSEPVFIKKLRAPNAERKEFMAMLTGDARKDFVLLSKALRFWLEHNP